MDPSKDVDETRPGSPRRLRTRLGLVAFVVLVLAAFGLGPSVSPALAKGGGQMTPKVVGGTVAPDGSWPSQAALLSSSISNGYLAQFCGGTLIDEGWVLTAAHCVTDGEGNVAPASAIEVAIGVNKLDDITSSDRIDIASVRVSPGWNPATYQWDFALLELSNPSAQPTMEMIIPSQASLTAGGQPAAVAGWGCTLPKPPGDDACSGGYPVDLIEANVDFVSDAECGSGSSYGGDFAPAVMICAGVYPAGTRDTCFGDSGGPLVAFATGGEKVLAGVTSWGFGCAQPDLPGVYARILAGRDWILTTIEQNLRLGVTRSGTGSGTVTSSPVGISCGSDCSNDFAYGTEVILTAKAGSGSGFTGWSGACSGTGRCVLTIREASSVNANFKKGPTVSLKAKPPKRTHSRKATFRFKASQSGSTFKCRIDGKSWQKCKSPKTYKNLKRGRNHTFRVKATKGAITGPVKKYTWNVKRH